MEINTSFALGQSFSVHRGFRLAILYLTLVQWAFFICGFGTVDLTSMGSEPMSGGGQHH